jgi:hypothetical protein
VGEMAGGEVHGRAARAATSGGRSRPGGRG